MGPYKGEHSLRFCTDAKRPVTLIGGMNGAGKTTIINSILLLFYGKRSQISQKSKVSYAKYLKTFMHNGIDIDKEVWIELDMIVRSDVTETNLTVRRSWKVFDGKHSEKLQVWKDGQEDSYLASNWDTYVEELLPIGVSGLFFFDAEKIGKIASEDETSETLRDAIYSLLGIDLIERLVIDLRRLVADNQLKLRSNSQDNNELVEIGKNIVQIIHEKDISLQEIGGLENKLVREKAQLQQKEKEYQQEGGLFMENKGYLEQERELIKSRLDEISGTLKEIACGALPLLLVKPILKRAKVSVEKCDKINESKLLLPRMEERDKKLIDELVILGIDVSVLQQIADKMETDRSELAELAQGKSNWPHIPMLKQQITNLLDNQFVNINRRSGKLVEEFEKLSHDLDQVERQLHYELDDEKMSDLLKQIRGLIETVAYLEQKKDNMESNQKEIESKLNFMEKKYRYLLRHVIESEIGNKEAQRIIKYALESEKIMKTFKDRLLGQKVAILEKNINQAFKPLIGKESLVSTIKIEPLSLRMYLYDNSGIEFPKSQLSEGEKQMLAIAFLWGLARSSGRSLPVIIDTPMARLDSSHRMNFVKNYIPQSSHQVIVLSTDEEINGQYLLPLEKYTGKKFLLMFDDLTRSSIIKEGYFS